MSHVYYRFYYHIIWCTKKRLDLIDSEIELKLKKLIADKIKQLKCKEIEFNTFNDHCHLLASIPPKINVSEFIGQIKGYSAHEINKTSSEKQIEWQEGFGALTLSDKGVHFVKKYIQNQKTHHAEKKLINVLEFVPKEKKD